MKDKVEFFLFFQIDQGKTLQARQGIEQILRDDLCLVFKFYPSSMVLGHVADPSRFDADLDPTLNINADPDPSFTCNSR